MMLELGIFCLSQPGCYGRGKMEERGKGGRHRVYKGQGGLLKMLYECSRPMRKQ